MLMIGEYSTPETRVWLMERVRSKEEDIEVRTISLDTLGKIGDPIAISLIREIALGDTWKKDSDKILQHKAIGWLGKLNITDTVPSLVKMFRKGRWIPNKRRDQLKIVIAQALWKMEDDTARQVVRDGCRNTSGSVRRVCETLTQKHIDIKENN